jgi:hypothetical protein
MNTSEGAMGAAPCGPLPILKQEEQGSVPSLPCPALIPEFPMEGKPRIMRHHRSITMDYGEK